MGLRDVYDGRQSWAEFLGSQAKFANFSQALERRGNPGSVKVRLSPADYHLALESGLGAISGDIGRSNSGGPIVNLELGIEKLIGGIGQLNADFNLLLGDLVWKFEMSQETLNNILQEIRLAEFEREARAYRSRAER